jgi:hypothetical protein
MRSRPGLVRHAVLVALAVLLAPRVARATQMGGGGVVLLVLLVAGAVALLGLVTLVGTLVSHRRARPALGWIISSLLTGAITLVVGGFLLWAVPGDRELMTAGGAALGIAVGNLAAAMSAVGKRSAARAP